MSDKLLTLLPSTWSALLAQGGLARPILAFGVGKTSDIDVPAFRQLIRIWSTPRRWRRIGRT